MIVKKIISSVVLSVLLTSQTIASNTLTFEDGTAIEVRSVGYSVKHGDQTFEFKPTGAVFKNEQTKEIVEEYTGAATDNRQEFSWAEATFEPGGSSPKHFHKVGKEIYFITQGSKKAFTMVGDQKVLMPTGARIVIEPNTNHFIENHSQKNVKLLVICTPAWKFEDFNMVSQ